MALRTEEAEHKKVLAKGYEIYQSELKRQMAMDFDDLLLNTVILLEDNIDVRNAVNKKWEYISAKISLASIIVIWWIMIP